MEKKILLDEHRDLADDFIARTNPPEADKEAIRESFKEYVAPERVDLFEAHQTAANSLEALFDALANAGLRDGLHAPGVMSLHLFEFGRKENGGNCKVSPKARNYNEGLKSMYKSI